MKVYSLLLARGYSVERDTIRVITLPKGANLYKGWH